MNGTGEANNSNSEMRSLLQSTDGNAIDLENHYQSATAFLICSGPSLKDLNLGCLHARGILTCTVNNAGSMFRSNLWVGFDHPSNFCDAIWRDPGILKFVPVQRMDETIRTRNSSGELSETDEAVRTMPATIGFRSNRIFRPEHWLTEDSVNCGGEENEGDINSQAGSRSVMLVALRLLYYLGIRRVFLLGCDFRMSHSAENYAFKQSRSRRSIRSNNRIYRTLSERFKLLLPYFEKGGFEVFNCNPESSLTVFPFVEFNEAVKTATADMPTQIETDGMYDRPKNS